MIWIYHNLKTDMRLPKLFISLFYEYCLILHVTEGLEGLDYLAKF